jgi:hypothetical protein
VGREVGVEILGGGEQRAHDLLAGQRVHVHQRGEKPCGGGENVLGAVGGYRNGAAHGGDAARIRIR